MSRDHPVPVKKRAKRGTMSSVYFYHDTLKAIRSLKRSRKEKSENKLINDLILQAHGKENK